MLVSNFFFLLCDSYRIQTYNLLIRSQMLYSVELRSQKQSYFLIASAKLQLSAVTANLFMDFFLFLSRKGVEEGNMFHLPLYLFLPFAHIRAGTQ